MRRDSRLVVTARPRERRVPHALCVKHPTVRTIFRPAFAALWQKVALTPCTHVLAEVPNLGTRASHSLIDRPRTLRADPLHPLCAEFCERDS
jgi:hypothetical protein